jgi:uncharacterized phage infection (PIP) family protein YhgE
MARDESSNYEDMSASWDDGERPSQRAWTHEDIYPTQKHDSDTSSDYESSDSDEDDDDSTEEESSEEDETSESSTSTSFADEDPPKPKSNRSSSNYESLSEPDSSSDVDSCSASIPKAPSGSETTANGGKNSSADIANALKTSTLAISEAAEQRKKQLQDIEKSDADLKAQEKQMLDISRHLDDEIQKVSNVIENSDDNLKKLAEERVAEKSRSKVERNTSFKQIEREARIERAKERIEKENEEKEQKERAERNAKLAGNHHDPSEKARIERAYTWYTRMAMPNREKMKERIVLMSSTTGVAVEDVDLLPWNAKGTFVSVATMMKILRTSSSGVGRKK